MTSTIWKYEFDLRKGDRHSFTMPHGARPICIQMQGELICLWAEVDPRESFESRTFRIVGTGHPLPPQQRSYIGTVQAGPFVWHIYEETVE